MKNWNFRPEKQDAPWSLLKYHRKCPKVSRSYCYTVWSAVGVYFYPIANLLYCCEKYTDSLTATKSYLTLIIVFISDHCTFLGTAFYTSRKLITKEHVELR